MNIFLTGATGFIGRHLAQALALAGHRVRCAARRSDARLAAYETVTIDYENARLPQVWLPHLQGMDVVINAVGIFTERGAATFAAVHDAAPRALFAACAAANISRVVQISALGATVDADTEFLRSKARADEFLLNQNICALVLQPSLVFGAQGESARLFATLAALPLVALPDGGAQRVQPVHIDDVCTAVVNFAQSAPRSAFGRVPAVGPAALRLRDYLAALRSALGQPAPQTVLAPSSASLIALARWWPTPWLQADALRMLQRGNCASAELFAALLQRPPRAPQTFAADAIELDRRVKIDAAVALLRWSLALLWIATGIISFGIYPVQQSMALLARADIPVSLQLPLLYAAALLDIFIGISIMRIHRPWIWHLSGVTIIFFSAVIAWKLPEFWLHPYAPMLKNIPLLAATYLLLFWDTVQSKS